MAKITETKKPHPFSKEGRAIRAQQEAQNVEQSTENIVEKTTEPKKADNLQVILERLERLEKENEELKSNTATKIKNAKERNNDPKKFSYKLRG
jgi:uncharacterized protein (UPF0335 family)